MFYGEQNQKNKMAWVPTTNEQARIYFYNIYTRETSWAPPPGAPRIELEHWEKTYAARKTKKKKASAPARRFSPLADASLLESEITTEVDALRDPAGLIEASSF